jgi:hypothetical protein
MNSLIQQVASDDKSASCPFFIREKEPLNLETPFDSSAKVAFTNLFYTRNHFPMSEIDDASWKLKVEAEVEMPLESEPERASAYGMPARCGLARMRRKWEGILTSKADGALGQLGAVAERSHSGYDVAVADSRGQNCCAP